MKLFIVHHNAKQDVKGNYNCATKIKIRAKKSTEKDLMSAKVKIL